MATKRDYTGVATAQLAEVYRKYGPSDTALFAASINMDERDLKKIVVTQNYAFTGLKVVDEICTGLGISLSALVRSGDLTIVPGHERWQAARRMAEDEYRTLLEGDGVPPEVVDLEPLSLAYEIAGLPAPTEEEIEDRVNALRDLRARLVVETEDQRARLKNDSERARNTRSKVA